MTKMIKLTDANSKLEIHLNPDCVHAMQLLPNDGGRPLRTRVDCKIGDRALCLFVLELPTKIIELAGAEGQS